MCSDIIILVTSVDIIFPHAPTLVERERRKK